MKHILYTAALVVTGYFAGAAAASAETPPAPAAEESRMPALPTPEQVGQLPETVRKAEALKIKQVILSRTARMREQRHRQTPENAAACAALAEQLKAPEPLVKLLQLERDGSLSGRELYEYRQTMQNLLRVYGVDALAIRLFVEAMSAPAQDLDKAAEALPLETMFNLLPQQPATMPELELQVTALADIYARMVDIYSGITSAEQAAQAIPRLMPLLYENDATLPLRMRISSERDSSHLQMIYMRLVMPYRQELVVQRARLQDEGFYGSVLLKALDYLLD